MAKFSAIFAALVFIAVVVFAFQDPSSPPEEQDEILTSDSVGSALVTTRREFDAIPSWRLFGEYVEPVVSVVQEESKHSDIEPDLSEIPETRIPMKLSGIAYAETASQAFAIVISADGSQKDYRVGDSINDQAKVHLIEPKRVVIERDGTYEALTLPEHKDALETSPRTATRPQPAPTRMARPPKINNT